MTQGSRRAAIHSDLRAVVTWLAAAWLAAACAGYGGSPWHHHLERAERLVLSGDAAAARDEYRKALAEAASPEERGEVQIALAELLSAPEPGPTAADRQEAEHLYRRALEQLAPPWANDGAQRLAALARNNLAVLLLERGRAAEAFALLEDPAPSQAPADLQAPLLHNRGLAAERLSRPGAALEDFLAAVAEDPSYRPAVESAGRLVLGLSPERGPEIAAWTADRLVAIGELAAAEVLLARALDAWGASGPLVSSLTGYLASARVGPREFLQRWRPRLRGGAELGIATLEAVYTRELDSETRIEALAGSRAWRSGTDRRRLAALLEMLGDHATRADRPAAAAVRYALAWRLDPGRFDAFYRLARLLGSAGGELDPAGRRLDALATELEREFGEAAAVQLTQEIADAFLMLGLAAADQGRPGATVVHLEMAARLRRTLGAAEPPLLRRQLAEAEAALDQASSARYNYLQAAKLYKDFGQSEIAAYMRAKAEKLSKEPSRPLGPAADPFGDEFADLVHALMPSVSVTLHHPPYLGITVDRVAFARPKGKCSDELVNALIEDFVANGADVAERQRIEALLEEIDFSASGIIDEDHVVSLGQMLGPSTVIFVETQWCAVDRSRRHEMRERKTKSGEKVSYPVFFATTRVDFKGSIRVVDLATGRIFTAKTLEESGSRTVSSEDDYPDFPTAYGLRDEALDAAVGKVHRMFFPWTETRELLYFKGKKCHLDTAYQLLRIDDVEGAAEQSASNLEFCLSQHKINPKKIKPKIVARAYYNLGMSYFMLDDFDKALEQLQQAYRLKPGRRIREMILECKRAKELAEEIKRYETRTAPAQKENGGRGWDRSRW